ncbi:MULTISPECIES: hypothetical protein [unclassified Psychrobacter]|uniref:hypothetical protein n=1 Tax=unclassified Psychrobacter TaxID=196806 RepID=UPI001886C68D|nr:MULTISPECIES: hypothetical protein [unclassified Psychrobacter]MBF2719531.1 hypothetical protein [Psychrobacter sp. NG254]MBH0006958.1 hypothetical protein [Psychrobacter sp. SWN149]MBI0426826.1 hypothetical protein [Psychrobacter sp. NG27]
MKFSCALETSSERIRLVNVISPLIKAGYQLISQKQESSENGGNIIRVVAKSQEPKTQADLIEDLSSIEGCTLFNLEIDEDDNAASSSVPAKKVLDEKSVLSAIGAYYPKIADIVSQYEASLPADRRMTALHELGRKVGGGIYQRDYALGSPLKMPKTISRELVPALKGLSKVKAKDNIIYLIKCPFCKSSDHNHSGCHFVVGYIEGFLASNPAVDMIQVEETNCGAGSTNICEFTIR